MEKNSIELSWMPDLAGIPAVLADLNLWKIIVFSIIVSMLTAIPVAARPAAVKTGRVQLSMTVSQIFFILSRLANLFYLPLMAVFVDQATKTGKTQLLAYQIQAIILATSVGALLSFVGLKNFISLYSFTVEKIEEFGSLAGCIKAHLNPRRWKSLLTAFLDSSPLGVRLGQLKGVSADFLVINVFANAIWCAGALCAVFVSAQYPKYATTALLLSGLVNAFPAIAFSVWVDPKAALITDRALKGERPAEQVNIAAYHLALGNFVGCLFGVFAFGPGCSLIAIAAKGLGQQGQGLSDGIWIVVAINALVTLLASTTYASRISAVITGRVATALSIYNLFFLVTRLAGQVYAPVLGSVSDHLKHGHLDELEALFRKIIGGASVGVLVGILLLPTFVEIYNKAVYQLDKRGDLAKVMLLCLLPKNWPAIFSCLRAPSLLGVTTGDFKSLPKTFLFGNILVLSIQTVGVMAATFAGAQLGDGLSRTATLLSSVVNGLATITLSVVVDPTIAMIADRCASNERPQKDVKTMAVGLLGGMLLGTLLAQAVFGPAVSLIGFAATIFSKLMH